MKSKPTWSNTSGYSATSAFFVCGGTGQQQQEGTDLMDESSSTMAQQIAQAAIAFEQQRTGHLPRSATVVLSDDTLVITLHGALSPAEKALAKTPAGITQLQEFHRQLFANASGSLRQEIERITGVEVCEASAEVEPAASAVVKVFTSGTVVQVFLLADSVGMETWSGTNPDGGG